MTANRPPWTSSGVQARAGEQVTWLAWDEVTAIKPLGIVMPSRVCLAVRVGPGPAVRSARDTLTFTADRNGPVELGSVFPAGGELAPDGSISTDRVPYRTQSGTLTAVIIRWPSGTDPRVALEAVADRDPSGLCSAEAARLADPPQPPPGWETHPLTPPEELYTASLRGIACHCHASGSSCVTPLTSH